MLVIPDIPGYHMEACLGGGPMTTVYSGRDTATDVPCAIKTLREDWEDQPIAIKLLQREARAGLGVRHPHLVRITHAHVICPPHFLVMEMVRGESLRRVLRRDFRLEVGAAIWIVRQVAEALAELHRQGFIHGDIKPDNVRVGEDGSAVLIDLGFAHRPGENASFLQQGYLLGTANYLAPELCELEAGRDFGSDLFSLGVMFFEMLTGRLPYPAGTLSQTMRRHRCDPPADVRAHRSLPAPLVVLINALLERRSEDRPDATTVVQQLVRMEMAVLKRRTMA